MAERKQLFPVFEVPPVVEKQAEQKQKYYGSVYFDFQTGDFKQDGAARLVASNGREAYRQWCIKAAVTERGTYLAYGSNYGAEILEAMAQPDRSAVESALERTISEAIMENPKTEYVRGFLFSWEGNGLHCQFIVKGQDIEEQPVSIAYPK